ncbi:MULTISPECIES: flagellar hook-basal body complex protein [Sporomusa]|uniref:flagellar hook-basal body complex protein n=1 Tax=Sporomusa TaxID=2375 RepID=UPI003158742A
MMTSIYSGVSGLKAQQTKLNVIGNNIANVNTAGYKAQTVSFADLLSQTLSGATAANTTTSQGGTNAKQVGTGVGVAATTTITTVGSTQSTGNANDVSISGNGYFIVQGGGSSNYQFTRAGNFGVDAAGNLTVNGYNICGWSDFTIAADGSYVFNTDKAVSPLNLFSNGKQVLAASATTKSTLTGAIDASAEAQGTVTPATAATLGSADNATANATGLTAASDDLTSLAGATITVNGTAITIQSGDTIQTVLDSLNAISGVTASFAAGDGTNGYIQLSTSAAGSTAALTVSGDNSVLTGLLGATTGADTTLTATGTDAVNPTGLIDTSNLEADGTTTLTVYDSLGNAYNVQVSLYKSYVDSSDPDNPVTYWQWEADTADSNLSVNGSGLLAFDKNGKIITTNDTYDATPSITLTPTNSNASAAAFSVALDMTQVTTSANTASLTNTSDGYPAGTLDDFSIGSDGVITGVYSNGYTQPLGIIALANFTNPAGLLKIGDNLYTTTVNSGAFTGGVIAGSAGTGSLSAGTLEMSNVDLSEQFAEMMITQRAYQANSKIISASDECLQAVINMVR